MTTPRTDVWLSCVDVPPPEGANVEYRRLWICPECGDDDENGKFPLPSNAKYCGICAEDNGRDIRLLVTDVQWRTIEEPK